ncbi:ccr4 associated factor [Malassezia brasiliensis]|uniref:Ccr4 associated factor n=1 Tax=Malassezia brasiliensis TaxID=1821822 RepID=A0AAF0DTV5_9BASI|nr:ccr4 associated factor [Malassezia brasiliensis]
MLRPLAGALGAWRGACGVVRPLSSGPARTSVATLPQRTVLSLEGRDTLKFLQGAITNNVQRLEEERRAGAVARDVFYAAFLNPQGRMVADALLYHRAQANEPSVLIEIDAQVQDDLVKFLKRFKLRSKFRITDVSDTWDVRQVWGPGAEQLINNAPTDDSCLVAARDVRAPSMGWRVLCPAGETPSFLASAEQVSPEEYTIHRMLSGVPEGANELNSGTSLPLECCVDYMNGVDFHKGCYIGQELTARTHFTGLIRKRVMPVMLTRPDAPHRTPIRLSSMSSLNVAQMCD